MTIKNPHRKDIARLSALAFVVVGSFHFSASAQVQVESERNPSPRASRHYDRRYDLANRAEQAQFIRKVKAANTESASFRKSLWPLSIWRAKLR